MPSSVYFPPQRANGSYREKGRMTANGLPSYSSSIQEKFHRHSYSMSWYIPVSVPLPGSGRRRLRLALPNAGRLYRSSVSRFGRKRGPLLLFFALIATIFTVFAFTKRFGTEAKQWPKLTPHDTTLVFKRDDLQRIWKWEVESGHYPSRMDLPGKLNIRTTINNPAVPPSKNTLPSRFRPPPTAATRIESTGPKRVYLDLQSRPPHVAYPPRPLPGSIADMDMVMEHCNFDKHKYVRDCLEVLRVGGGLDAGKRLRRGNMDNWKYIFVEDTSEPTIHPPPPTEKERSGLGKNVEATEDSDGDFKKKWGREWEQPLSLPPPAKYNSFSDLPTPCDPESPHIFHMYWTGPFTDKPYMAILSFLFTQNTGLQHQDDTVVDARACRPKFWIWVSPGPAAFPPKPTALRDMFGQLKSNPWSAPFLHPRFKNVVQFKLWNVTEQLDGVPEIKDEWRKMDTLFNSGGYKFQVPAGKAGTEAESTEEDSSKDDPLSRTGSMSPEEYDKFSVMMSDMARFLFTHRFGGIYVDADTIFLRDWEEIFGWKGAFAYRWSRLPTFNTAVFHMNQGSALGSFLFRTALAHDLDFHPMTVSKYVKEAYLDGLLLSLPDALFDSAWLNTENYQMDRPAQPFFTKFSHFVEPPPLEAAAPNALGFDGFFKGAYSYHFHNMWWAAFDPSRNWPDLGPTFITGERIARAEAAKAGGASSEAGIVESEDRVEDDARDLSWATVLKRTFEAYIRGERPNMYGEWLVGIEKPQ